MMNDIIFMVLLSIASLLSGYIFLRSITRLKSILKERQRAIQKLTIHNEIMKDDFELAKYTNHAILKLSSYASSIAPDYIVGINKGGIMVGAYIASSLNIPDERFLKCFVSSETQSVEYDDDSISGNVLVVDDICRTGKTIDLAIRTLKSTFRDIKHIYTATLFSYIEDDLLPGYKNLSFCSFLVDSKNIKLLWSNYTDYPAPENEIREKISRLQAMSLDEIADEVSADLHINRLRRA